MSGFVQYSVCAAGDCRRSTQRTHYYAHAFWAEQFHARQWSNDPAPHIGHIYDLTGPESADLDHYARVFSAALGRTIRYRDAPTSEWSEKLRAAGVSEHVIHHLTVMTELHKQGRYDR